MPAAGRRTLIPYYESFINSIYFLKFIIATNTETGIKIKLIINIVNFICNFEPKNICHFKAYVLHNKQTKK